jgi:hypothetical protein
MLCQNQHMRGFLSTHCLAMGALISATTAAAAQPPHDKPGEGVLCLLGLASIASEIGRRCPGKNDPAFQAAVDQSVAMLDRYVATNGHFTSAEIAKFKKEQARAGGPLAEVCEREAFSIYDGLHKLGPAAILEDARETVARPGVPTWDDCL